MLKELVKEFLQILEETEEGYSGRVFHPVTINSCRVLKTKRISELLEKMKDCVKSHED